MSLIIKLCFFHWRKQNAAICLQIICFHDQVRNSYVEILPYIKHTQKVQNLHNNVVSTDYHQAPIFKTNMNFMDAECTSK